MTPDTYNPGNGAAVWVLPNGITASVIADPRQALRFELCATWHSGTPVEYGGVSEPGLFTRLSSAEAESLLACLTGLPPEGRLT